MVTVMGHKEFRNWRIASGMTQEKAARFFDRTTRSIQHYEKGTRPVPRYIKMMIEVGSK